MNKFIVAAGFCFMSAAAFSQTQALTADVVKAPASIEMAAKADVGLVNEKKVMTVDKADKKKKPRREKTHKECSRMKS